MKKKIIYGLFIFISIFVVSCNSASAPPPKAQILVSLAPYEHLIKKIVGEEYQIQTVVPLGSDPHSYEPSAKKTSQMADATVWFTIGEGFEKKLLKAMKQKNPRVKTIDLRDQIPLIQNHGCCHHHHANDIDSHLWLSPRITLLHISIITNALSEQFPENQEKFYQNAKRLMEEFQKLDLELTELSAGLKHRSFLVSHPAFAYFCNDYHLEQISIEHEGKEPKPKDLQETMTKAKINDTRLALAMPQHPMKGIFLVAEKLNLPVHTIDPYAPNAQETLRQLARWMKDLDTTQ